VPEALLAFPEISGLPARSVAEDAELLLVVRGRQVARAEAEVSALPGRLVAQLALARAVVSNALVELPDLSLAAFAQIAVAAPDALALCAAQAESAQVFAAPELVARVELRAVALDPSEALAAQGLHAPAAVSEFGHGVPAHSVSTVQAELLKVLVQAAAAESRAALEHSASDVARVEPGRAAVAPPVVVARDQSEAACARLGAAALASYPLCAQADAVQSFGDPLSVPAALLYRCV
jgi:hypothetical protein